MSPHDDDRELGGRWHRDGECMRRPIDPLEEASRRNPHRLYRNPARGWITGVCAGVADYFGLAPLLVRVLLVFALLTPLIVPAIIGYLVLSLALPTKPEPAFRSPDEERFWRSVSRAPGDTFSELRHRLRDQELRLRRMEAYVTSAQYEIDRELRRRSR